MEIIIMTNNTLTITEATNIIKKEVNASDKIEQKFMYSVKASQLRTLVFVEGKYQMINNDEAKEIKEKEGVLVYLVIHSTNPTSPFYALMASNAGMTDRIESPSRHVTAVAKRENTTGGISYVYVDKPMYVNDWEWHIQLNGVKQKQIFMIK
jgi:hypothetical protein